jgi:FlaA1/EpsC-like NDP-sugar epimerase
MEEFGNIGKFGKYRKILIVLFHIFAISFSFLDAFALRFDMRIPPEYWSSFYTLLPAIIIIKLSVFWWLGLSEGWWRYVSMYDFLLILKANAIGTALFTLYVVFFYSENILPRSVLILDGLLCFSVMIGVRVFTRIFRERILLKTKSSHANVKSVVIVGAGGVGQNIVKEIRENPKLQKVVVGFVDNDPRRHGKIFQGVPVLGAVSDLNKICLKNAIDMVLIAQTSVSPLELREIVGFCKQSDIVSKILPPVGDIIDGKVSLEHVRPVSLEDLLGRQPVRLEVENIRQYLKGKRILVTGAAGSIGSEICRQVAHFGPRSLILFENAETPLFRLEKELRETFPKLAVHPCLGDIRHKDKVDHFFGKHLPQVVFHAAAYKHVPMSEINPVEVVQNNVFGTRNVVDAAFQNGADHFVMVSTDKAVNPTNVMGASKRAAEIYIQNLPRSGRTKLVTVRFGNVLGSSGSVIPTFRDQIARGGPVTVTHPEITRFFMTIPEAVQLVLQAGSMGEGGEIFVLDMGDPVKIVRLAEEMIRLSGLRPYEDIEIAFTGLRPGEKLYEELLIAGEGVKATRHEKIRVLSATSYDRVKILELMMALEGAAKAMDSENLLRILKEIVPEYHPTDEEVKTPQKTEEDRDKIFEGVIVMPKNRN